MFREVGNVSDVFIPRKRSRNGNKFAFIRFFNKWEAERAIKAFDGRFVVGKRLQANLAQEKKRKQVWITKREAEMDPDGTQLNMKAQCRQSGNPSKYEIPIVEAQPDKDIIKRLENCIVGSTTEIREVKWLLNCFAEQGWHEMWISRISYWKYIIGFYNEKLKDELKENDWGKIRQWFKQIEPWSLLSEKEEREAIICIHGLPLMLWNKKNLDQISNLWGKMCNEVKHIPGDAKNCFVTISTIHKGKIDGKVELKVGDIQYIVQISEVEAMPEHGTESMEDFNKGASSVPTIDKHDKSKTVESQSDLRGSRTKPVPTSKEGESGEREEVGDSANEVRSKHGTSGAQENNDLDPGLVVGSPCRAVVDQLIELDNEQTGNKHVMEEDCNFSDVGNQSGHPILNNKGRGNTVLEESEGTLSQTADQLNGRREILSGENKENEYTINSPVSEEESEENIHLEYEDPKVPEFMERKRKSKYFMDINRYMLGSKLILPRPQKSEKAKKKKGPTPEAAPVKSKKDGPLEPEAENSNRTVSATDSEVHRFNSLIIRRQEAIATWEIGKMVGFHSSNEEEAIKEIERLQDRSKTRKL